MIASLQPGRRNALHHVTLGKDVDNEQGQDGDDGAGQQQVPLSAVFVLEGGQADGDGAQFGGGDVQHRAQQFVPVVDKGDEEKGGHRRDGERQEDIEIDAKSGSAIQHGGFYQLIGDAGEEFTQHEGSKGANQKRGHDQGEIGIEPVEFGHQQKFGDDGDFDGDHCGRKQKGEQERTSPEFHLGKGKTGQRGGDDLSDAGHTGHKKGVGRVAQKVVLGQDLDVGVPHPLFEEQIGIKLRRQRENRPARFEGGGKHPQEGEDGGKSKKGQDQISNGVLQPAFMPD